MQHYKWVGSLYSDWFREPATPLESTWRWPIALIEAQKLVKQRLGIKIPDDYYISKDGWLYIRTDYSKLLRQWGAFTALFKFINRISKEKQNFETEILPAYKAILSSWRKNSDGLNGMGNFALWQWMNGVMEVDVAYTIKIIYVGTYGFLFDSLLGWFYGKFVKDDPVGYHTLLAGFPNRTYEMNVELFELGQIEKESGSFKKRFANFLLEFGLEKSDWELLFPVLGEHPEAIMHLIESYHNHPELDPRLRLRTAEAKRQKKFEFALNHLKYSFITKPIFKWIVRWAQAYVPLRETRQHYIGAGTYFIRQGLKLLASCLGLDPEMIFYLEKAEINRAVEGRFDLLDLERITKERYNLREAKKKNPPYE